MEKLTIRIFEFDGKTLISCTVPLSGEFNNTSPILEQIKTQLSLYKNEQPEGVLESVKKNFPENNKILTLLEEIMKNKVIEEISGVHWNTIDGKNVLIVIQ